MLFDGKQVEVKRTTYDNNKTLAVVLVEEGTNEIYEVVTVNIDSTEYVCGPFNDMAFVDANNLPEVERFLKENGLAESAGHLEVNGMCEYPLYKFNLDKIPVLPEDPEVDPDGDFLVEVEVKFEDESISSMSLSLKKKGLEEAKDILPDVLKECQEKGITSGSLNISVTVSQHGEWVDSDEAWFTLKDGKLTMCDVSDDEEWHIVADEPFDFEE